MACIMLGAIEMEKSGQIWVHVEVESTRLPFGR